MDNLNNVLSSGNKYSDIARMNFDAQALPYDVRYYWESAEEDPENYSGIGKIHTNEEVHCPRNPFEKDYKEYEEYEPNGPSLYEEEEDYWDKRDKWTAVMDTIIILTDDGDTQTIITTITGVTDSTAQDVSDILTNLGPWLSETAAETLIDNANMFSSTQIVSVLAASPDLFMDADVYQFAFGPDSPLSASDQSVLEVASNRFTDRTRLRLKQRHIRMNIDHIIQSAMRQLIYSTDPLKYEKQRTWLGRKESYSADIAIAATYMQEGNYSGAEIYLRSLLSRSEFSEQHIADINALINWYQNLALVYQDNRNESSLNAQEIAVLEQMAHADLLLAKIEAQAILDYYYGYSFEAEEGVEERSQSYQRPKKESGMPDSNIKINPNPNDGNFEIQWDNATQDATIQQVKILTLDGKTILEQNYSGIKEKLTLHLENTQAGVYIYQITDSTGKLHTGKFIVR